MLVAVLFSHIITVSLSEHNEFQSLLNLLYGGSKREVGEEEERAGRGLAASSSTRIGLKQYEIKSKL